MPAQQAVSGTAYLSIDGVSYLLVGSFTYSPGQIEREGLVGMDGPQGFKIKPRFGVIKGQLRDTGGLTVSDFTDMDSVTVVCELANGKLVTGTNCFTTGAPEVNAEDSTFEVEWNSQRVTEIVSV